MYSITWSRIRGIYIKGVTNNSSHLCQSSTVCYRPHVCHFSLQIYKPDHPWLMHCDHISCMEHILYIHKILEEASSIGTELQGTWPVYQCFYSQEWSILKSSIQFQYNLEQGGIEPWTFFFHFVKTSRFL